MTPGAGDVAAFCRAPDRELVAALLHGADEGLVAMRRRELVAALLGPEADPLRLTRLEGAALRRDPPALGDALRSRGFFAGRGVVSLEGATDALAPMLAGVLADAAPEDAFLVVSAGALKGSSELRRLFRAGRRLIALEVLAEAPGEREIEARLAELGLCCGLEEEARHLLAGLGGSLDRVSFDRLLECVALYSLDAPAPLRAEDVRLLSPAGLDAEIDAFVDAVAGGRPEQVGPTLRRVVAAGASAVTLLLGLQRHFRGMMRAASGGTAWGPRRDILAAQARAWRPGRLEQAGRMLYEADARVRSAERAPALALVERCALRLALMAQP